MKKGGFKKKLGSEAKIYFCIMEENVNIIQLYTYTPFGQVHSFSGSLIQPYQYVGGEEYYTEETTGLQLLGQRWYDEEVGRFISRDPIGKVYELGTWVTLSLPDFSLFSSLKIPLELNILNSDVAC